MIDRENIQYVKNILNVSNQSIDYKIVDNVMQTMHVHADRKEDILDSFSPNQCLSKSALLQAVDNLEILDKDSTVVIWGGWYGSILIPKLAKKVKKVVNIDMDEETTKISKKIFDSYENIDYICADVFDKCLKTYLDTNLIINTSCEHMPPMKEWKWFGPGAIKEDNEIGKDPKISSNCYFAFQSNNMFGIEGHVNCVKSIEEFKNQLPDRAEVLYEEEVEDSRGTRYMLVGKFMPL